MVKRNIYIQGDILLRSARTVSKSVSHSLLRGRGAAERVSKTIGKFWAFFKDIHFSLFVLIPLSWDAEPSFHPWSTLVVARASESGGLEIVDEWPEGELPPLPPGALYAPLERVERDEPPPASRRILRAGGNGR